MFSFSRNEQIVIIVLVFSLAVGGAILVVKKTRGFPNSGISQKEEKALEGETITVQVSGAVKEPKSYPLPLGSRVFDSLLAAGGPLPGADLDSLNLAALLEDKTEVQVSYRDGGNWNREEEQPELGGFLRTSIYNMPKEIRNGRRGRIFVGASKPPPLKEGEIDLNAASQEELIRLPGIGPALAGRIIEHRKDKGPFQRIEELIEVRGIGAVMLSKIKKYVRVEVPSLSEEASSAETGFPPNRESETQSEGVGVETSSKININSATAEELMVLPGIGPSMAGRIIDHRRGNGPFAKIEDLIEVKGIGAKTLDRFKNLITVGGVND